MRTICLLFLAVSVRFAAVAGVPKFIDNGIGSPEVIYKIPEMKFQPKCDVEGKALDLLFILDSSGSLKTDFPAIIKVITRIIDHIAIGPSATRVALTQYSSRARTEFQFNEVSYSRHILERFQLLKPLLGLTETHIGLEHSMNELNVTKGMRGPEVPKIVFLITDGRSTDEAADKDIIAKFRAKFPDVQIWAYGTGKYVDMGGLVRYTGDESKVLQYTDIETGAVELLFDEYKGEEVCSEAPICIPGSDKPLDLIVIMDSSSSIKESFPKMKQFVVEQILQRITIHPDAVRMALINYASFAQREWDFDDQIRKEPMIRDVQALEVKRGTTGTGDALKEAHALITEGPESTGVRNASVQKLVVVFTDGHAVVDPELVAKRLRRNEHLDIIAVALSDDTNIEELIKITGSSKNVYTARQETEFQQRFLEYYGFGCPGHDLDLDAPAVRNPIQITCNANSVKVEVRTRKGFSGQLFATDHFADPRCVVAGDGSSVVKMVLTDGQCGITRQETEARDGKTGYLLVGQLTLQFHGRVLTRSDRTIDVSCFHESDDVGAGNDVGAIKLQSPQQVQCRYTLHKYEPAGCILLDSTVGVAVFHTWRCDITSRHMSYLVHDCYADADGKTLPFLNENGCTVDPILLQTPNYKKLPFQVVSQAAIFKFKGSSTVTFHCKISLCDREQNVECRNMIPPVCAAQPPAAARSRRRRDGLAAETKENFLATFDVQTREINVLLPNALRSKETVNNYCSN